MTTRLTVKFNRLPQISADAKDNAARAVRTSTLAINQIAKASMRGSKSGRIYSRGKKSHQASAPGEAPAIDTSKLVNSLQEEFENGGLTGYAFTNIDYAPHLEYGTVKMAARPFYVPAAEREFKNFSRDMKRIFNE